MAPRAENSFHMTREKDASQPSPGAKGSLQLCALTAFLTCLLMLTWAVIPTFIGTEPLEPPVLVRRLFIPIGLIILNVAGVMLVSSIVAALFAQSNWRRRSAAAGPFLTGIFLFAAEAVLVWQISLALSLNRRADPVFWVLGEVGVCFLCTWLLLEPLMRLSRDPSDAARLDGLRWTGLYRHVLLPRMKARLLIASLLPFAAGLIFFLPTLSS